MNCHPAHTRTEMTWIVMPGQCNSLGTVFGGQVMAWIDVCAAVAAQRFCRGNVVTASMDSMSFTGPIQLGQIAACYQAAPTGQAVAVPASSGFLEIAINSGNAGEELHLAPGAAIQIRA